MRSGASKVCSARGCARCSSGAFPRLRCRRTICACIRGSPDPRPTVSKPPAASPKGAPRPPMGLYALKSDEEFLVADAFGDIKGESDGLFYRDTRLLSRFSL